MLVVPLTFHPAGGLKVFAGPGVEIETRNEESSDDSRFLVRAGIAYSFEFGERYLLIPNLDFDFIDEEGDEVATAAVFGVTLGFAFCSQNLVVVGFKALLDISDGSRTRQGFDAIVDVTVSISLKRRRTHGQAASARAKLEQLRCGRWMSRECPPNERSALDTAINAAHQCDDITAAMATQANLMKQSESGRFAVGANDFFHINLREKRSANAGSGDLEATLGAFHRARRLPGSRRQLRRPRDQRRTSFVSETADAETSCQLYNAVIIPLSHTFLISRASIHCAGEHRARQTRNYLHGDIE